TLARLRDLATTTGDIHACIASSDLARHGTQQCLGQSPAPLGLRGAEPIRLRSATHGILPVDPGDTQPYPDRRPLLRRCTGGRLTWPRRVGEPHPLPDPGDAAPGTVRRRPPPDRVVRGAGRNRARPHHPLSPEHAYPDGTRGPGAAPSLSAPGSSSRPGARHAQQHTGPAAAARLILLPVRRTATRCRVQRTGMGRDENLGTVMERCVPGEPAVNLNHAIKQRRTACSVLLSALNSALRPNRPVNGQRSDSRGFWVYK